MKQTALMEMMRKLPSKEKEMVEMEERRMKRLDLQEIKQNIWRKWRGKKEKSEEKRKETEDERIERLTTNIEKILQKISDEKKLEEKKQNEWIVRRKKLLEDGRKLQEEKERKNRNRTIRLEKKAKLEEKWEMLRWISKFIEEHKDRWEKERIDREKAGRGETTTSWREKNREEKIEIIRGDWEENET